MGTAMAIKYAQASQYLIVPEDRKNTKPMMSKTRENRLNTVFLSDRISISTGDVRLISSFTETGSQLMPGVIAAVQTFGARLNLHPHLPVLVTAGGVDEAGVFHWSSSPGSSRIFPARARSRCVIRGCTLMRIGARSRPAMRLSLSGWRRRSSGLSPPTAGPRGDMFRVLWNSVRVPLLCLLRAFPTPFLLGFNSN